MLQRVLRLSNSWFQWPSVTRSSSQPIQSVQWTTSFHSTSSRNSKSEDGDRRVRVENGSFRLSIAKPLHRDLHINGMWLRDHCRCPTCYNATTNQRSVDIIDLEAKSKIKSAFLGDDDKRVLSVVWGDDHRSTFALDWILDNWCNPGSHRLSKRVLWSGEDMTKLGGLPTVSYLDIVDGKNDGLKRLIQDIKIFGVGCISGVPATFEETKRVCEMVALPEETIYGKFWKFSAENMEHADTAYSTLALGAHTDLTYYSQTAGLQVLHKLEHSGGDGGATLLVDGFKVAEDLRQQDSKAFQFLSTKPIPCHYLELGQDLVSDEVVIDVHPMTGQLKQFRFNVYDRALLNTFQSIDQVDEFYRAYIRLAKLVRNAENEYWINLGPGTIIFIDNFRVMHGRSSFTGKRVMCGCYLQRDSFLSKARILGV